MIAKTCKRAELARILDLSERRVTELVKLGQIPKPNGAGYDLPASVRGYIRFLRSKHGSLTDERARLTKAQASLMELKLRAQEGELLEAGLIQDHWMNLLATFRIRMLTIPRKFATHFSQETDPITIETLLDEEIRQALKELAAYDAKQSPPENTAGRATRRTDRRAAPEADRQSVG